MRYEHTPRPEIEYHPHIQNLIETQDKRARTRTEFREKEKAKQDREDIIRDAPVFALTDFWCQDCHKDFKAQSVKEVEIDWSKENQRIAFYRTKHWCGAWCMRFITDRFADPYWFKSRAVRADKRLHHNDILQPFESGYHMLYKNNK